jgi:hypothetical protein
MSNILIKCKTREGFLFKILAELFQNIIKNCSLVFTKEGISMRAIDNKEEIRKIVDLTMSADNFLTYTYNHDEPELYVGVTISQFHKMLKNVKKKDGVCFKIYKDKLDRLEINKILKDTGRVTVSCLPIIPMQHLHIPLPEEEYNIQYDHPIIIPSSDYPKDCKELEGVGKIITMVKTGTRIVVSSKCEDIFVNKIPMGDVDSDDEDGDEPVYKEDFNMEDLKRITKLASLSTTMKLYVKEGLPLHVRSRVGSLGYISVYIKSRREIEDDKEFYEDEDSD